MTVVVFIISATVSTFAQSQSIGISGEQTGIPAKIKTPSAAIKTPVYTDVAAELGLPYNITLDDMMKPGYVDPIVSQANKWKAEGMNDTEIVNKFAEQEVIYDPKTQVWAFGHIPTAEEQKRLPTIHTYSGPSTRGQVTAGMWTNDYAYAGYHYYMCPGELTVNTNHQGTDLYYVTTHIGCGAGGCFEIGVYRYYLDPSHIWVFTYSQNDNPHWGYTNIEVDTTTYHTYAITYTGTHNGNGYLYAAAIDGQTIRTIYMSSLYCEISECYEVFNSPGYQYTTELDSANFLTQYLYTPGGNWIPWNSNVLDEPGTPRQDYPTRLSRWISGESWFNTMWVQY